MTTDTSSHIGKRILIPLLYDYHLFEYFRHLVPRLLEDGFHVTLVTFDERVKATYACDHPRFALRDAPAHLRACLNRSRRLSFRIPLWVFGWPWTFALSRRYDLIIVPQDNKPLGYMFARWRKSLICQPGLAYFTKAYVLRKNFPPDSIPDGALAHESRFRIARMDALDRVLGFGFSRFRHTPHCNKYYTVVGDDMREYLVDSGVPENRIFVVGNPNFEGVLDIEQKEVDSSSFATKLFDQKNAVRSGKLFTFFLSYIRLTQAETEELLQVLTALRDVFPDSLCVLKMHPRFDTSQVKLLSQCFRDRGLSVKLIFTKADNLDNARLVALSDAVFVKGSNVAFTAMLLGKPVVAFNLTNAVDGQNLFSFLSGPLQLKSSTDLHDVLTRLNDPAEVEGILKRQRETCLKLCRPIASPCGEIAKAVNHILT